MKKFLISIISITLILTNIFPCASAINTNEISNETVSVLISETIQDFGDGSKIITRIYEDIPLNNYSTYSTSFTKTGSKTQTGYSNSNDVIWTLTSKGTFSVVSGTSSKCTAASYSYTAPGSGWSLKSGTGSATKSSNKAIAKGTFIKKVLGVTVETVNATCTLTCDVNGNLS